MPGWRGFRAAGRFIEAAGCIVSEQESIDPAPDGTCPSADFLQIGGAVGAIGAVERFEEDRFEIRS